MKEKLNRIALGIVVPLILLLTWIVLSRSGRYSRIIMPTVGDIVKALTKKAGDGTLFHDLGVSFSIVLRGYLFGVVSGLVFGVIMGLNPVVYKLLSPLLNSVRQIPPLAWIPLLILWVGIGDDAKIILIGIGVFFPMLLNTITGIREVSGKYIEFAANYKIRKSDLFWKILIPGATPSIFVGLRLGASTSWMSIVAAEMIAAIAGVGYRINAARNMMETPTVIAYMIVIGVVGGTMDAILRGLEKHAIRWKNSEKK